MTGYTSCIDDNPNITLKEFTLKCARAFGYCIHQRDDSADDPPKKVLVSLYHRNELKKAKKRYATFKSMTKKEWSADWVEYCEKKQRDLREELSRKQTLKKNYERLLNEVKNWTVPSADFQGLKDFMISQLTDSIEFDCKTESIERELARDPITLEEWIELNLRSAKGDIEYHTKEYAKELEGVAAQNKWIDTLYSAKF